MSPESYTRKLTAVFSADVAGYSRLMGDDEAETVKTLTAYRRILGELIRQHRGTVIDSPGDNVLAEFASVVDAVQCAVAAQNEFKARNAELPESRRMMFRIGVNLGDVIEEEGRIYGDGVNIAARLEALADPGGICISKTSFDHIETKLPLGYEYLGEQEVKNIAKPVGAYRVLMEPRITVADVKAKERTLPLWRRGSVVAGGVAIALVVIAALIWNFWSRRPTVEPASVEKMAYSLPDNPSIAVLPFKSLSDDQAQDFLADGVTENLITALSKTPKMFVIASNSVFTYKGKAVKVQQVAEELGVRYVLEGSLQKSGDRLRMTAQLIDAVEGHHLWAERYDGDLGDLFSFQDKITMKILTAVEVKLTEGEAAASHAKGTENLEAYLKDLQGREYLRKMTKEDNAIARKLLEEAIALDPRFASPYVGLAHSHLLDARRGWNANPRDSLEKAKNLTQKALILDDSLDMAHAVAGTLSCAEREYEKAISQGQRAVALGPSNSGNMAMLAFTLRLAGKADEAVPWAEKAVRLDPKPPLLYLNILALAYRDAGRYEKAIATCKRVLQGNPYFGGFTLLSLLVSQYFLGHEEEARAGLEQLLKKEPDLNIEEVKASFNRLGYRSESLYEPIIQAMRELGVPETPPLPLPDKPSIAVLPFVNISDDKAQEFFSDGLTEEIITALSKTPKLFVIARNSCFVYKGKPVNVQQVSRELGVKYVLEGSVRRSGDQLRITAQLIDATTGNHLWAERYDREMMDIFVIQDEITMRIISSVQVKLTEGEAAGFYAKGTESLDAYLKILEGRKLGHALNRDDNTLAQKKFEEAIASDPKCALAYALLGFTHVMDFAFGINREESMKKASEYTQKALSLDDSQLYIYTTMEFMYGFRRQHEEAIASGEKAVRIAPGSADAQFSLGRALNFACSDKEALVYLGKAVRMNPFPPAHYFMHIGSAHLNLRNYEEAISALKKALAITPRNEFARGCLMVAYAEMGRMEEARAELQEYRKTNPKPTPPELYEKRSPWKDPKVTERFVEAMRKLSS